MAQGQIKKPSSSSIRKPASSSSNRPSASGNKITKKHLTQKRPKKSKLVKAAKINKKFTSGLTAQTERMLGEKAGHLEMLGQGRKKINGAGVGEGNGKKGKKSGKKG